MTDLETGAWLATVLILVAPFFVSIARDQRMDRQRKAMKTRQMREAMWLMCDRRSKAKWN